MGKHNLPNQIKPQALQQAVYTLIDAIPEEVSKAVNSVNQETGLPIA